jgi:hypothetical protein
MRSPNDADHRPARVMSDEKTASINPNHATGNTSHDDRCRRVKRS